MNISAPLLPFALSVLSILTETVVVLLHLDFVTVVTDVVPGGGGGGSCVFIRANCTDISIGGISVEYSCRGMGEDASPLQLACLGDLCRLLFLSVCVQGDVDSFLSFYCVQKADMLVGNRERSFYSEIFEGSGLN